MNISHILHSVYHIPSNSCSLIEKFILTILKYDPDDRPTIPHLLSLLSSPTTSF
jgi:hypothetical protein